MHLQMFAVASSGTADTATRNDATGTGARLEGPAIPTQINPVPRAGSSLDLEPVPSAGMKA